MSGGQACTCWVQIHGKRWAVTQRRCNHSAFNGYRETPSAYSEVVCLNCHARWRTKAAYVDALPDATSEEHIRAMTNERT